MIMKNDIKKDIILDMTFETKIFSVKRSQGTKNNLNQELLNPRREIFNQRE